MARHRKASPTHRTRRRLTAMTLAVVGIAGLGLASAATLNVSGGYLGAGTAVVASCQTSGAIRVSFTTAWAPTPTPAAYRASAVTLAGIDYACNGLHVKVQVLSTSGSLVDLNPTSVLSVPPAGNGTVTIDFPTATRPTAVSISSVAVVIHS